jgi:hypothetical protein
VGAPRRSSIELAWVKEDAGRGGGPPELPGGVGTAAPVDTERGIAPRDGGTPSPENAGLDERGGGGISLAEDWGRLPALDMGGPTGGGMLPELAARLGGAEPRGGGGVARTAAAELGSFLLTHFLRSLS